MALVKDSLWNTVNETKTIPRGDSAEYGTKLEMRKDCVLTLVALSLEPSLLYLISDPQDPVVVTKKVSDQKTWAN